VKVNFSLKSNEFQCEPSQSREWGPRLRQTPYLKCCAKEKEFLTICEKENIIYQVFSPPET